MKRLLTRILKYVAYLGAAVVILLAVAVGLFRLLLPKLPAYQEEIKNWANAAIGMEVEFSGMDARWRLSGPELTFYDARLATGDDALPVLHADEVSVGVGLLRLLLDLELVADRVLIEDARVEVLQRPDGGWEVQGIPVEELPEWRGKPGTDAGALVVVAEDIRIDLKLAHRGKPLTFDIENVQFRRNERQREMDASIVLPEMLGARFDVAASQRLTGTGDAAPWRLFAEGDAVSVAGLAALWPDGFRVQSGTADVQLWLELAAGAASGTTVNFTLHDVRVAHEVESNDTPQAMAFSAEGRAEFSRGDSGWLLAAHELTLTTPRGEWPESSLTLRVTHDGDGGIERVQADATYLDFDDLPAIAPLLPEGYRALLEELTPSGVLRDLDLTVINPESPARRYDASATFRRAGVAPYRGWPGLRGFTGSIRADQSGGRLEIDAVNMLFNHPAWFTEPIAVGEAAGTVIWRRSGGETTILSDSVHIANSDIQTQSSLQVVLPADGESPVVDLQTAWSAGNIGVIEHYLPDKLTKPGLYRWLRDALVAGEVTSATTRLSGTLSAFPFDGGEGTFRTEARVEGAVLRYAGKWPDVENIDAKIVIDRMQLYSVENSAVSAGNHVVDASVEIADLRRPVLDIDAHATGSLDTIYAFARQSPIDSLFGGHLARVDVAGAASFDLRLSYPVLDKESYDFTTAIRSEQGTLEVTGLPAPVTDIRGEVTITRDTIASRSLVGRFLGSPITIDLARAGPDMPSYSVLARAQGSIAAAGLVGGFDVPLGDRLQGETTYDLTVRFPRAGTREPVPLEILVDSDLDGLAVQVPAPLGKPAETVRPLSASIVFPEDGRIVTSGRLSDAAHWTLDFSQQNAGWDFERGALALGGAAADTPETRGLHVTGSTPVLNVDEWLELATSGSGGPAFGERIRSIDLVVDDLSVVGQDLARHHFTVDRSAFGWVVQVDGVEIAGSITVPYDFSGSRPIELDMRKLVLPGSEEGEEEAALAAGEELTDPRSLPPLKLSAGEFSLGNRHFGSLRAEFLRTPRGLVADSIETSSETFDITGSAGWVVEESDPAGQVTWVKARLTSRNVQQTLAHLDYQPGIEGEAMDVRFDVSWSGGPRQDFLGTLNGRVDVRFGAGQLNEIEPGAGRVFGLMSIVALPRRLSLDFSDVFERGLGFDEITGHFRLESGQAYTCDLSLKGPAADVGIVGRTGLVKQVYNQAAVVSANVGNTLPVVGAVVAGPQVAAALLIFSQIFKKPLQEMGQIYYGIGGTWGEPTIDVIEAPRFAEVSEMAGCLQRDAS